MVRGIAQTNLRPRLLDLYTSRTMHVAARIYADDAPVCVCFPPGIATREMPGDDLAAQYGLNWISVSTRDRDYFQYADLPAAEDAIRSFVARFPRVMTYGHSMGGYGALLCSEAVGADVVLACSPQVAVGPGAPPRYRRGADHRARVREEFGFPNDDMARRLSRTAQVIALFDPLDADDAGHVRMLEAIRPVTSLIVPLSGHCTIGKLTAFGLASRLVRDVLVDAFDAADWTRRLRRARRGPVRVRWLIDRLLADGRPVPEALFNRLACDLSGLPWTSLRTYARHACSCGYARALASILARLLAEPEYPTDPNLPTDLDDFVAVLEREPEVRGDLPSILARIEEAVLGAKDVRRNRATLHLAGARLHRAAGDAAEAAERLWLASGLLSAWAPQNAIVADLFAEFGDHDRASQIARRARVCTESDFKPEIAEIRKATAERDWAGVVRVCRTAVAAGMPPVRIAQHHAHAHHRLGQFAECLDVLAPLLALGSPSKKAYRMAGDCLSRLDRHEEAHALLLKAEAAQPTDWRDQQMLAVSYQRLNRLPEAIEAYQAAYALRPSEALSMRIAQLRTQLPSARFPVAVRAGA